MNKHLHWVMIGSIAALLCGCWDQQLLKNERNVSISGMDQGTDGMLQSTVSIRDITVTEAGSKDRSEVHSVMARSSQHATELIDEEVSGGYSSAKLRVLLIGEALVKNADIKPYLDLYYRDPKSPLTARIAVTKGKAKDMIELQHIGTKTIGLYIDDLLSSMEESSAIPRVNIETLHPLDRGFDFALPYLINHKGMPTVSGIAMFSGTKMTGKLDRDEARVYLLLSGSKNKNARLTLKSVDLNNTNSYNYVTFEVKKLTRKLKVIVSDKQQIRVKLDLKLRVSILEDPSDHLYKMSVMHDLERFLSEQMRDESIAIIQKMQLAKHDGFGIARRLMSFHPELWKQIDWKKEYPQIPFDTSVSLQIVNTGITE
ncbi:Ger(x)C family spore germination protein [Bacillus sp. FJAT-26390]|uniref:Ger(x)C family spore germination protein n=1 Tax=Bacillus sp. FJAT-26390 TaxID=1743142 RepID=UPI000807BD05|nr:Ger(x)C family spore germination protein [Bacillus sp. FJAT-26390]OBZ17626.1 hypothetical protein A7975_07160 [Bacillus sp. FJAT-26390]